MHPNRRVGDPMTRLDVFIQHQKRLGIYRGNTQAQHDFDDVNACGHWMMYLGFPEFYLGEDDEIKAHARLCGYLAIERYARLKK